MSNELIPVFTEMDVAQISNWVEKSNHRGDYVILSSGESWTPESILTEVKKGTILGYIPADIIIEIVTQYRKSYEEIRR